MNERVEYIYLLMCSRADVKRGGALLDAGLKFGLAKPKRNETTRLATAKDVLGYLTCDRSKIAALDEAIKAYIKSGAIKPDLSQIML